MRPFTILSHASPIPANRMQQHQEATVGYLELDISAPGHRPDSLPASPCSLSQFQPISRGNGMVDFSIRMKNKLRFSTCDAPHVPTSKTHEEIILVELRGDLLMITALGADGSPGSRVYAQRTIDLPETSLFMILPELPSHVRDGAFFPALGTVAILQPPPGQQRQLRAVGTDNNSGQCHGWIFDAIEDASSSN